jgi:hypothetical protein
MDEYVTVRAYHRKIGETVDPRSVHDRKLLPVVNLKNADAQSVHHGAGDGVGRPLVAK